MIQFNERSTLGYVSGSPSLADINLAVTAVNRGFDKCRIISGYNIREESSTTGAEDFSFSYYPNPTAGITTVAFVAPSDGLAIIELYDLNGSLVKTEFNANVVEGMGYQVSFNTDLLSAGVYFIHTTIGGNASAFGKLIVVKD
jgi:hypothetical protein